MYSSSELPWTKIHEFLLSIGTVREAKAFCVRVIEQIYGLVPYDQARVYFVDANGKVHDQALIGVEPVWSDAYLGYYSQIENGRYSIPARLENGGRSIPEFEGGVYDWTTCTSDEFITDYIKPQRLRFSAGGAFYDAEDFAKGVFSLDRTGHAQYTRKEIDIMRIIQPHLDNLHRNLFVHASGSAGAVRGACRGAGTQPQRNGDCRVAVQRDDAGQDSRQAIPERADRLPACR